MTPNQPPQDPNRRIENPEKPPEIIPPNVPYIPQRANPDPEVFPQRSPEIHPDRDPFELPNNPEPDRGPEIVPPEINPR